MSSNPGRIQHITGYNSSDKQMILFIQPDHKSICKMHNEDRLYIGRIQPIVLLNSGNHTVFISAYLSNMLYVLVGLYRSKECIVKIASGMPQLYVAWKICLHACEFLWIEIFMKSIKRF